MSMLILHAYPHLHGDERAAETHVHRTVTVKVDFEIHDMEHPIGYDVDIQCWSNINSDQWKGYPLTVYNQWASLKPLKLYQQRRLDDYSCEVKQTRQENGRWYTYRTAGSIMASRPGMYRCTFRGRYKPKFTDEWSQWFWIGARDYFGPGRNAYIRVRSLWNIQRTRWTDVCYHCLSRNGRIPHEHLPSHLLKWLSRLNDRKWFNCASCHHSYHHGRHTSLLNL